MEQQMTPEMLQVPDKKCKFESESVANVIPLYLGEIKKRFCNKVQLFLSVTTYKIIYAFFYQI